jgi:ABC-type antimicrobial peptide transport system permease subunit
LIHAADSARTERASLNYVGPDYLKSLRLAVSTGRDISGSDRLRTNKVVVVSQSLAETLWPGQSPIGQRISLTRTAGAFEVVGVAPDAFVSGVQADASAKFIFLAEQQDEDRVTGGASFFDSGETTFYVRYTGNLDAAVSSFSRTVREVDDRIAIGYIRTMKTQLDTSGPQRILTRLLMFFGVVSLVIAGIGQYAVVAFNMRRRLREFGIRLALGASPRSLLEMVLREGLFLTAAGLFTGFLLSFAVGTALRGFLFGVTPTDFRAYIAVSILLGAASILACYLPAHDAAHVDPLVALRDE